MIEQPTLTSFKLNAVVNCGRVLRTTEKLFSSKKEALKCSVVHLATKTDLPSSFYVIIQSYHENTQGLCLKSVCHFRYIFIACLEHDIVCCVQALMHTETHFQTQRNSLRTLTRATGRLLVHIFDSEHHWDRSARDHPQFSDD